jgi:phosphoglycolate phosphatase
MVSGLLGAECRDPEAEIADFRARYAEWRTPANSLYEGVGTGLRELAADGLKLAICSNKPQNLCDKVIADVGLSSVFSAVVGGAPDRRAKPHPELMERTLGQLRAEPRQCIYVGDSEIDHMVAKTVGIPFLFVSYGYADEAWDRSGVSQFSHFAEIVEAIRDLRRASRVERRAA